MHYTVEMYLNEQNECIVEREVIVIEKIVKKEILKMCKDNKETIIKVEDIEYYTFPGDYFESELQAERNGYFWDDDLERWIKEITDHSTTVFERGVNHS